MRVNVHGSSHELYGIKNQDACLELVNENTLEKVRIVCDGCTNIDINDPKTFARTHSEVGAGLFCSLYEALENPFDADNFIKNANEIMERMLKLVSFDIKKILSNPKAIDFVTHNYCFTIFACFETKDSFVVYHLGDGVIFTINQFDVVSYIERKYGNKPPYLVYNLWLEDEKKNTFTKFIFPKDDFKNVGIATDGLQFILGKAISDSDKLYMDRIFVSNENFLTNPENDLINFIKKHPMIFTDDVTAVW